MRDRKNIIFFVKWCKRLAKQIDKGLSTHKTQQQLANVLAKVRTWHDLVTTLAHTTGLTRSMVLRVYGLDR